MIIGLIKIFIANILMPFLIGFSFERKNMRKGESLFVSLINGYMLIFSIMQVLTLIFFKLSLSYHVLRNTVIWLIVTLGIISFIMNWKLLAKSVRTCFSIILEDRKKCVFVCLIVILVLLQTQVVVKKQHTDDDDAYYIGVAEAAVSSDTIMRIDPYTGEKQEFPSTRYVLSPFPFYHSIMADVVGVKPVVYAHTIHPFIMIPLGYVCVYLLSTILYKNEKDYYKRLIFLFFMVSINTFSNYSIYSQGTFFFFRIWQGKAMLCSIVLPVILYYAYRIEDKFIPTRWVSLFLAMLSACFVSSMGVVLGAIELGIIALVELCVTKSWKKCIQLMLAAFPNILFGIIFLMIS